jgi:AcrR family transcriptional regulator
VIGFSDHQRDLTNFLQNESSGPLTSFRKLGKVACESKIGMFTGVNSNATASQTLPQGPAKRALLSLPNRKHDRAGKQKALIQAALRLFATKGYDATTTREIAAAAGCAEGLIHRYFKGKAGLLPALVEYHFSQELAEMRHRPPSGGSLEEEFLQLVDWEIEHLWKNRDFLRVFISRALMDPAIAVMIKRGMLSSRTPAMMKRLKRHCRCSNLSPKNLEVLAHSVGMFGLVFGFMRPTILGQDRKQARNMAAILASVLVRGLQNLRAD